MPRWCNASLRAFLRWARRLQYWSAPMRISTGTFSLTGCTVSRPAKPWARPQYWRWSDRRVILRTSGQLTKWPPRCSGKRWSGLRSSAWSKKLHGKQKPPPNQIRLSAQVQRPEPKGEILNPRVYRIGLRDRNARAAAISRALDASHLPGACMRKCSTSTLNCSGSCRNAKWLTWGSMSSPLSGM